MDHAAIDRAKEHFGDLLEKQMARVALLKEEDEFIDWSTRDKIVIGVIGGDGIGPAITETARQVLERLLEEHVASERIQFRSIDGLTIENRADRKSTRLNSSHA